MDKDFNRWNIKKQSLDAAVDGAHCHEREIWWCSIGVNVGSEQHSQTEDFSRPIIVVRRFTRDIFWGVPLTTKIKDGIPFRFRVTVEGVKNDALILQMRAYDRKRLVRQLSTLPKETFILLRREIMNAI
jgi:mRNA interferase MazF